MNENIFEIAKELPNTTEMIGDLKNLNSTIGKILNYVANVDNENIKLKSDIIGLHEKLFDANLKLQDKESITTDNKHIQILEKLKDIKKRNQKYCDLRDDSLIERMSAVNNFIDEMIKFIEELK